MIKTLFDMRFNHFITTTVAGVMLIFSYVIVSLMWLGYLVSADQPNFFGRLIIFIIGLPVSFIFIRVWFETVIALIKTAEASVQIKEILEKKISPSQSQERSP